MYEWMNGQINEWIKDTYSNQQTVLGLENPGNYFLNFQNCTCIIYRHLRGNRMLCLWGRKKKETEREVGWCLTRCHFLHILENKKEMPSPFRNEGHRKKKISDKWQHEWKEMTEARCTLSAPVFLKMKNKILSKYFTN